MKNTKKILIALMVVCTSFSIVCYAGEKGGSGIDGEESIILETFQRTQMCPEAPAKKLCAKLDEKMNDPMREIKILSHEEQNETDFFFACCFNSNSAPDLIP